MLFDAPTYHADIHWAKLPAGFTWHEVAAVAIDRDDRVFVFARGEHRVLIFAPDGRFLSSWGEGLFARPHGITIHDDAVYCCDDLDHTVRKFTLDGRLLLTLGTSGQASDTGATSLDFRTIVRAAGPFHYPTNLAVAPNGSLYICDGYGNARVHHFSAAGQLLKSWGEPGTGPGQFRLPHGIAVDARGTVYVADRENSRVQLFTPDGGFVAEWTDVARPCQVCVDGEAQVWVAELGFKAGMWPGTSAPPGASGGRLSVFDREGRLRGRWGGGANPAAAGDFFAPHDVRVDSRGNVYVAEVIRSAGGGALYPLSPAGRGESDRITRDSEVHTHEGLNHESLAFPRLQRHASRRHRGAALRRGRGSRRTALRAAERDRGAARAGHSHAGLRPGEAAH